jgi:LmbE family N-acetylglucosaminyl deacetylase
MVSDKPGPVGGLSLERSRWRTARWLVIAPHADDETIGAGALIHTLAKLGLLAGVVILTDGAASHAHADAASRSRLVAARRREARLALRRLTGAADPCLPVFLDWPDAHPHPTDSAQARDTVRRLGWLCRQRRVDAIATTAVDEPHCDHEAAGRLAAAAARAARRRVEIFDYHVWGHAPKTGGLRVSTKPLVAGRRAYALAAHRSQLTPDFGSGFRLEPVRKLQARADTLYRRDTHV